MAEALFSGIIPPVLTPFDENGGLDTAALEKVLERLIAGGVHGLFILGTTGEGPSLSYDLRRCLIRQTNTITGGRVPILVGITDTSFDESVRLADFAAENGASALVVAPPCYHPVTQEDLLRYLEQLARRLPLPTLLYNMPSHCKTWYEIDTLRRAFEIDRYIGLKDSSHDMDYFRKAAELMLPQKRLSLLIGPEELLPEALKIGAHGGVCGGAHLLPRLFVRVVEAGAAGDATAMEQLTKRIDDLRAVYKAGGGFLKSMKAAMAILGIIQNRLAPPLYPLGGEVFESVRRKLAEVGIDLSTLE